MTSGKAQSWNAPCSPLPAHYWRGQRFPCRASLCTGTSGWSECASESQAQVWCDGHSACPAFQMLFSLSSTEAGADQSPLPVCSSVQSNIKAPASAPLQNPLSFRSWPIGRRSCEGKAVSPERRAVWGRALCSSLHSEKQWVTVICASCYIHEGCTFTLRLSFGQHKNHSQAFHLYTVTNLLPALKKVPWAKICFDIKAPGFSLEHRKLPPFSFTPPVKILSTIV